MGKRLWWRHLIVAAFVVLFAYLGGRGTIAQANFSRFDLWQVNVAPASDGGLGITETIDLDFANDPGHGLLLDIGTEFGVPTDIEVGSPDAPDRFTSTTGSLEHELRIGDPRVTVVGQHRYEVEYRLPDAPSKGGDELILDLLVEPELDVERFRATISGFELDRPTCLVGATYDTTECEITSSANGFYQIELDRVSAGDSVTVAGTIKRVVTPDGSAAASVLPPPRAQWLVDQRLVGVGIGLAGVAGALASYLWCRRRGRNQVFGGGGAAEAAEIEPAAESTSHQATAHEATGQDATGQEAAGQDASTSLVTDGQLFAMATVEFEPPPIAPWEARVLLRERFRDAEVFNAFLSGLAGAGGIEITPTDGGVAIGAGPEIDRVNARDRLHVNSILALGNPYITGTVDPRFRTVYDLIMFDLYQQLVNRQWWSRRTPRRRGAGAFGDWVAGGLFAVMLGPWIGLGSFLLATFVLRYSIVASALVSFVVCAIVGLVTYRVLTRSRTAAGSALTLRSESFRRFLDSSEGAHVQWAYEHDVVREYSGWAVALGEASAWSSAIEKAAIAGASAAVASGPFVLHRFGSSVRKSARPPLSKLVGSGGRQRSFGSSSSSRSRGSIRRGRAGGGGGGSRGGRW